MGTMVATIITFLIQEGIKNVTAESEYTSLVLVRLRNVRVYSELRALLCVQCDTQCTTRQLTGSDAPVP